MKTKNLRRPYAAPSAELIALVPSAPIASNNWTWNDKDDNGKWNQNHMGIDIFKLNVSATGFAEWVGDEEIDN